MAPYQVIYSIKGGHLASFTEQKSGAENGTRTRDPQLGKLMLYQLSYFRTEIHCNKNQL